MRARVIQINVLVVSAVLLCVGCGPPREAADELKQRTGLGALAIAYGQYSSSHRGMPPKSEKALKDFIEKQGPEFLTSLKVETVEDLFISPRDGEPYVVIYRKRSPIVAYEAVGADGTRWVAYDIGGAEELDEATFREKVPDAE